MHSQRSVPNTSSNTIAEYTGLLSNVLLHASALELSAAVTESIAKGSASGVDVGEKEDTLKEFDQLRRIASASDAADATSQHEDKQEALRSVWF